ncbi:MAG: hypothetical protein VW378_04135 [bacterium]
MFKLTKIIYLIFYFIVVFSHLSLFAQADVFSDEFGEDQELDIVSSTPSKQQKDDDFMDRFMKYWHTRGKGYVSSYASQGNNLSMYVTLLRASLSHPYKGFMFATTLETFHYSQRFDTTFEGGDGNNPLLSVHNKETAFLFRELYVRKSFPRLQLNLGRQLIVWGQMPVFSMIDYMLPREFSRTPLSVTKMDNRTPLNVFHLNYFPHESVEFSAYIFDKIESPTLVKDAMAVDTYSNAQVRTFYENSRRPFALRSLFRRSSYSLGLTYFKGMNWNFETIMPVIIQQGETTRYQLNREDKTFGFYDVEGYGLELSKMIGSSTLILELALQRRAMAVKDPEKSPSILTWLYENSDRTTLVDATILYYSIGYQGNYSWGDVAVMVLGSNFYFYDHPIQSDLEKHHASMAGTMPAFLISKNLFEASKLGCAVGLIPEGGIGFKLFFNSEYKETWKWMISPQFVQPMESYSFERKIAGSISVAVSRDF